MTNRFVSSLIIVPLAMMTAPAYAASASPTAGLKPNIGIAAQVGDEAVSSVDVENRIRFVVTTAHMSDTPDVISRIRPQIVRSLVDEKL